MGILNYLLNPYTRGSSLSVEVSWELRLVVGCHTFGLEVAWVGMLPLLLTILTGDSNRGYYNPD